MIRLIIQIPCYNEQATLARTLADLPRQVDGVDEVHWLIIDDGSSDRTAEVAREAGVDYVATHIGNRGLARAFMTGLESCVSHGADIIVNTDADNQYCADDIPALIAPILRNEAEIVIGARPISTTKHFSPTKKLLQWLGSWAVRVLSKTTVADAPSGFRAFSRRAAVRLNVFSEYTYTLETIIQAGHKGLAITSVPIRTNADTRPSKLVKSIMSYVRKSLLTIARIFVTYRPFETFAVPGGISALIGFALGLRFLVLYATGQGEGKVQSLILAAMMMGIGVGLIVVGMIGDLISVNRKLLEKIDWRMHVLEEHMRHNRTPPPSRGVPAPRSTVEIDVTGAPAEHRATP